jgi:benzoate/toluate 1,2-dioxygenase subunit beta
MSASTLLERAEAERLLFREARLLDERRFAEWLDMFGQDCRYWIPCGREDETGPWTHLVLDDREQLEDRVWQLQHPRHSSQSPPSRTTHLVSNVEVEEGQQGEAMVFSSFIVYEVRMTQGGSGEQRSFAGRYEHTLRQEDGEWRIAAKKIWLINRDLSIFNLTFLL